MCFNTLRQRFCDNFSLNKAFVRVCNKATLGSSYPIKNAIRVDRKNKVRGYRSHCLFIQLVIHQNETT